MSDEPVAWTNDDELKNIAGDWYGHFSLVENQQNKLPLYLHPPKPSPSRKPMTEEEIKELCPFTRQEFVTGFNSGIRFAEKHHGIGANE